MNDFGYSRSHGTAQKDLDAIITGGWDLVVAFSSNVVYCNLYISPGLMFCFWGYFSRSLYIVYIKAISSFDVIICFEL